ncbi:hypothetical protein [Streptomyces zaomyceticus]|uniref:hypothetical protein n=1 Tax=Streptomyces zaomyceticus TaxID=68286 RepID=UPI001679BD2E|nr:hypothetical protein [Streptomyces zaomyceticus]GHG10601.1 hypothetical protein GCM10018791_24900 [Streptomyces zaomyceticus]
MRSEDAVEIVRASLALAFPTATAEGLTRAAETVIRWGAEDVADHMNGPLTSQMLVDLLEVAGVPEEEFRPAEPETYLPAEPAGYRTWTRTEGMTPLPILPRPPDEPLPSHNPDNPDNPDNPNRRR